MKLFFFLFLSTLIVACNPYGFGYKKNPAYVLDEAHRAISNLDQESFLEVTGKEALCLYGNDKGLSYLKENIQVNPRELKLKPKVLESKHFSTPVFVGYWSYYHERYLIEIRDKSTKEVLFETIVDCDFGSEGEKNLALLHQPPETYQRKECRAIKLNPRTFKSLPLSQKCSPFKVEL